MTDNAFSSLETSDSNGKLRRVAIDPVTRVEGHGKVTLLLDEENRIKQARLHIVEFRGFEKFIQGRPYWEAPVIVQRLCGICPVSHHLAAAKAADQLVGVEQITPTAEKVRRLMHLGQTLQSHALHFFHLSSPDLLFGYDDDISHRNIIGVLKDYPEIAKQGVLMRKYGQEVIRVTAGKRVHGTAALPGGVNKSVHHDEKRYLLEEIDQIIEWSSEAVELARRLFTEDAEHSLDFATIDTNMMGMSRHDGALELFHGGLRAKRADGSMIFDNVDYRDYEMYIREQVKPWSYMKFPYLSELGPDDGWYRVGPLARVNNCDFISTPLAEKARVEFRSLVNNGLVQSTLAYHWARMIETLYCAEGIRDLLNDPDISGNDLQVRGEMQSCGIGAIEAPRGTLFHHYEIDDEGLITKANLIVSTTNNNSAMNASVRAAAHSLFDGREITEPMLNSIEVAIRAYDPCLSCATHALGKMPLQVSLVNAEGEVVQTRYKNSDCTVTD